VRPAVISLLVLIALATVGCGAVGPVKPSDGDPARGKALFIEHCGACHTLTDAGTTGAVGPDLDNAFLPDKQQGFEESTIIDVVRGQIAYAVLNTGTGNPGMTPNLVQGQDAKDVAVYVAKCAGNPHCGVTAATLPSS
jgi:mono/diheme cytochrome c family protein